MIDSREDVLHAIELGADGYIPKSASAIEFVGALETVIAGQIYLPPELFRKDYERSQPSCSSSAQPCFAANRPRVLTWRQREVVDLIRGGLGNAEIAERLGISKQTVRMHVSRILKQQNLENRTQVALLAVQERTPDTPIIVDTMIDSREDVLHAANRPRVLTWRQREVVDLIRDGLGNAEIAERSGISESTVKVHVSQILNQLNLKNRTQVALFAVQERDESQPKDLIKARMEAELLSKVGDGGFRRRVGADGCSAVVAEESPHDAQPVRLAMPPPMMAKKVSVMPTARQR